MIGNSKVQFDARGRYRNKIVNFRVSKEESDDLRRLVRLSGMTKQDYLIDRMLNREIKVYANPRVYKALKDSIDTLITKLDALDARELDPETALYIRDIFNIYVQLKDDASM